MASRLIVKRSFSASASKLSKSLRVSKDNRTHIIFGSNTDVGKTVVSAGLVRASLQQPAVTNYIKPLQCGGPYDDFFVETHAAPKEADMLTTTNLFAWETPAAPHIACFRENQPTSDAQVLEALTSCLAEQQQRNSGNSSVTWIETAGGVLSPSSASPHNTSPQHAVSRGWGWKPQADLYQPLAGAAPVVLVGDGRLGGISATLCTLESLLLRGYYVSGMVLLESESGKDNLSSFRDYASRQFKLRSGTGKPLFEDPVASIISLPELPAFPIPLHDWYDSAEVMEPLQALNEHLKNAWEEQVQELEGMRAAARETLWWPFTQHGKIEDDSQVTLIDSASGDNFYVVQTNEHKSGQLVRESKFDACASWWTQGVGHGESSIALAAGAAAGRYGHVIFPDVVHAPALALSEKLVGPKGPGHGWANRVFFTDDGSTAMEVAIKMGMKTYQKWHGLSEKDSSKFAWLVCAQQDCYHGDTLGVMDVAEPSVFNEGQHPWYEPKGLFLETPTLGFAEGHLEVFFADPNQTPIELDSVEEALDVESRIKTSLYGCYREWIETKWDDLDGSSIKIGSVMIEPILMGAGGMKFVDPLWQRALMDVARSRQVPIIFDEIASGLFRVGVRSCREIIKADPDIAGYAKLLTGGLLPLSVTLASEEIFNTFLGDEKGQALLHGHSYTAHPVGCVSALHSLEAYEEVLDKTTGGIQQLFDMEQVKALSRQPLVQHAFAMGTVLAVTLHPDASGGTGYAAASRTVPLAKILRERGVYARPLGNVIYIMASPLTSRDECARLCRVLDNAIIHYTACGDI